MHRLICAVIAVVLCAAVVSTFAEAKTGDTLSVTLSPAKAAATQPSNTNVTGSLTFTQQDQDVHVMGDVMGLSPGKHGMHIHEKADLSDPQLKSAGPHMDMGGKHHHGGLDTPERHAGDLGNIAADDSGKAHVDLVMKNVKLDDLRGHSVIVHASEDDMKTDPAGNSGGRVAGGEIK
jgi:Cu-Zn family superoxide dismutase